MSLILKLYLPSVLVQACVVVVVAAAVVVDAVFAHAFAKCELKYIIMKTNL